jgi:hypothetical protein
MLDELDKEEEKRAISLGPSMERWIRIRAWLEINS